MYTPVDPKVDFPKQEEAVLHFWEENDVFKKSVAQREGAGEYVFFDGPPFGTGLPVENLIEKELGLNSKTGIEKSSIAKFNEACRASVLRYVKEWWRTINRLGRWVDSIQ